MSKITMVIQRHEINLQVNFLFSNRFYPDLIVNNILFSTVTWGHNIYVKGLFRYLTPGVTTVVGGVVDGW